MYFERAFQFEEGEEQDEGGEFQSRAIWLAFCRLSDQLPFTRNDPVH